MNYTVVLSVIISFVICAVIGPRLIPVLLRMKVGQTVRDEGPESHKKKTGTPTMGGIMILIATIITSLFYVSAYPLIIPVLFLTVGFGIIGFVDDYIKVVKKRSLGLKAWQKMLGQLLVTGIFAFYLVRFTDISLAMIIPFTGGKVLDFGFLNIPVLFFVVIGTVNGTNFTDGLDGLASSVTAVVAAFFMIVSAIVGGGIEPVAGALGGALFGFLLFNLHPAKVFMGDTGSLALGGFVAGCAYMLQMPLFIILVGLIYLVEVLSVMIQVSYFKITHGKRIFKMSPIHHHFELSGWSETKIVGVFTIVTILMCLVAYMGL